MDGSAQHEPSTRKIHYLKRDGLPKARRDLEGRHKSDPVVLYTMGILETTVALFGREIRSLMASGSLSQADAKYSILVHVAMEDAANNLTPTQMEYLITTGLAAAGMSRSAVDAFV